MTSVLFNLDKDRVTGVVLIDYCKAFDMVDHELLLKKLEAWHCEYGTLMESLLFDCKEASSSPEWKKVK